MRRDPCPPHIILARKGKGLSTALRELSTIPEICEIDHTRQFGQMTNKTSKCQSPMLYSIQQPIERK
jgi:hypothetical protein